MKRESLIAFWLVPAPPEREYFAGLIHRLALELEAPVFEPHLTIYATALAGFDPVGVLQEVSATPIRLSVTGVEHSDRFTKCLYVNFESDAALQELCDRFRARCGDVQDYELKPHLSLVYKNLPTAIREKLASEVEVLLAEVNFDLLRVIECPPAIKTSADINAFRVLASRALSGCDG